MRGCTVGSWVGDRTQCSLEGERTLEALHCDLDVPCGDSCGSRRPRDSIQNSPTLARTSQSTAMWLKMAHEIMFTTPFEGVVGRIPLPAASRQCQRRRPSWCVRVQQGSPKDATHTSDDVFSGPFLLKQILIHRREFGTILRLDWFRVCVAHPVCHVRDIIVNVQSGRKNLGIVNVHFEPELTLRRLRERLRLITPHWPSYPNAVGIIMGDFDICEPEEGRFNVRNQTFTDGDTEKATLVSPSFSACPRDCDNLATLGGTPQRSGSYALTLGS